MKLGEYDFAIIGAGGSGLAAAMYGARLGMTVVVFGAMHGSENPIGGVITTTDIVENYPGFIKTSGAEIAKKLEEHARSYENVSIKNERVDEVKKTSQGFNLKTKKGEYGTKTVLFASGTKWKTLDIPGVKELERKGVNYCAICDGPLFKDKVVAIIGGSDSAGKDALLLSQFAKRVYIIYRGDEIHPEHVNLEKIRKNKKIEVITNTNLKEIRGKDFVAGVVLDRPYKGKKELDLDGVFMAIGHIPLSETAKHLGVKLNKKGEIIIDHMTAETNVPGAYAAGDVTNKRFKQLITGVGDACTAAYSAYEFLKREVR